MAQFTLLLSGKEFKCDGTVLDLTNERNGKPYQVFTVSSMQDAAGADVSQYLRPVDSKLRQNELDEKQKAHEARWTEALAKWQAEHPGATTEHIQAYKEHWLAQNPLNSLTDGLSGTIVDTDGVAHNVYFMRESENKFRSFQPRLKVDLENAPF